MTLTELDNLLKTNSETLGTSLQGYAQQLAKLAVAVYVAGYTLGSFIHQLNDRITYGTNRIQTKGQGEDRLYQCEGNGGSTPQTQSTVQRNRTVSKQHHQDLVVSAPVVSQVDATEHKQQAVTTTRRQAKAKGKSQTSCRKTSTAKTQATQAQTIGNLK